MNKLFAFVFSFVLIATMAMPSFSAGKAKKTEVINDEWEEGWETSFFEKESEKKQILKKDKEKTVVVPRESRRKPVQNEDDSIRLPSKEELEARERQRNSGIEDASKDRQISSSEKKATTSYSVSDEGILPQNAGYLSLSLFNGRVEHNGNYSFPGYGAEIAAGAKKGAMRSDVSFLYGLKSKAYNDGNTKFDSMSLLFNIYADLNITGDPKIVPYIGIGAGAADINLKTPAFKGNAVSLAWQASAGISYIFSRNVAADIGVRKINYGTSKIKGTEYIFDTTQIRLGIRYFF